MCGGVTVSGKEAVCMTESKIVGIVGADARALGFTERLIDAGHTVVGTDPDEDARESLAERYDVPVTESLDEMLAYPLDCVIIATPNRYHLEPTRKVLRAGYDVLLEKPLAHTLDVAESIGEVNARAESECYVAFHLRCCQAAVALRKAIQQGDLGEVYHTETTHLKPRGVPALGSWMTSRELSGGGALIDDGVHVLDFLQFVVGFSGIERVSGVTRQKFDPAEYETTTMFGEPGTRKRSDVEDSATVLIRMSDGASINLEVHWAANLPRREETRVYGTRGGALVDHWNRRLVLYEPTAEGAIDATEVEMAPDSWELDQRMLQAFLEGPDASTMELATVEEALRIQRIVDEVYANLQIVA